MHPMLKFVLIVLFCAVRSSRAETTPVPITPPDANPFGAPGFNTAAKPGSAEDARAVDVLKAAVQRIRDEIVPLGAELEARQTKLKHCTDILKKCDALDEERAEINANKALQRSERETQGYAREREKSKLLQALGPLNSDLLTAMNDLKKEVAALERKTAAKQAEIESLQAKIAAREKELKAKSEADRHASKFHILQKIQQVADLKFSRDVAFKNVEKQRAELVQDEKALDAAQAEFIAGSVQLDQLSKRVNLRESEKKIKGYLEASRVQWPQQKDALQKKINISKGRLDEAIEDIRNGQSVIDALTDEINALNAKYPN